MDFCCCFCKQPRLIPELADSYPDFGSMNKKRITFRGEPRVTKTMIPQSRPHSRKSSRPIVYGKFHELPLLRLEDQPLSSCSGLIIVQKLFRRPNTRSHWRRRIRYLQVTPNLWTRQDRFIVSIESDRLLSLLYPIRINPFSFGLKITSFWGHSNENS